MITPKELTDRARSVPQAKRLFDQMAALPLLDAAYFLLQNEGELDGIERRTGLRSAAFVYEPTAQPVQPGFGRYPTVIVQFEPHEMMFHRLKAAHPEATDGRLLEAIEAARKLNRTNAEDLARLRAECPGFEQKSYDKAHSKFQIANR